MPEAPWIKRCSHGINFTNKIAKDGKDREKFKKFFDDSQEKHKSNTGNNTRNTNSANDRGLTRSADKTGGNGGLPSARTRLLNNMVAETVSDRHKISLIEEGSPRI